MKLPYAAVVSVLLFTLALQTQSQTSQAKTAFSTQAPSKKSGSSSSQASKNKKTPTKTQEAGAHQFGQSYATLRPEQKKLIDDLVRRYNQTTGSKIVAEQGYDAARVSLRTTFDAVTHALLTAKLTDENGKSLGHAIDLVDALDAVMGEEQGVGGDRQFRLYVYLKPNAFDILGKSTEFYRDRDNTVYHKGFPTCFRLKNGPPSIQVSMSRDHRMADIDVDYRSSTFPKALFNGHLTASNSDVRAGNNLDTHDRRWEGLNGWWRELFASLGGSKPPKEEPSKNSNTVPLNPAVKADKGVEESAHDFLKSWVVDREPNNAIAYFSRRSYPCLEAIATRNGKPVPPGMVRFRIRMAMEEYNAKIGKVTSVNDVFEPAANWSPQLKETKNPYATEFRLVGVPTDAGDDLECMASVPDASAKKSKEKYFATAFREKQGDAKVMSLLWVQEGKYWKIVAIRIEDSGKEDIVPQIASASPSEPKPENFAGDAGVIRAATDFYQTWIVKRDATQAAGFASPRSYQCLAPPSNAVEKERKPPERIRTGLASVFTKVPVSGSLSEMMSSVDPVNELIRPVDHANSKAFALMAVPDQKAETFLCGRRQLPEKNPDLKPADATYGKYYLSASELNYGDETSPPLLLLWAQEKAHWKVVAWAVEVP